MPRSGPQAKPRSRVKTSANDWQTRKRREQERAVYIEAHGNVCELCGQTPNPRKPVGLNEDHDHKTGEHRGWLCARCNKFLHGWMTPKWLRAAADYLEART